MKKNKHVAKIYKYLGVILCFGALFIGGKNSAYAAENVDNPLAVLYSASDFQNSEGHAQGAIELEKITNQIYKQGYSHVTEALICGDYYYDDELSTSLSGEGIRSMQQVLEKQWGLDFDEIYFVQGNHDPEGTPNMDRTGGTDREHYSVYQINHDDFIWTQARNREVEKLTLEAAQKLEEWLAEKLISGYQKPIFIITHLPLHHSYRYDNRYSEHIFDVINDAAAQGLNIVYLFGHNHSKEYDTYLGGGAIFLQKGEEIIIPDVQGENTGDYKKEILNFTYMNAGYVGKSTDGVLSSCIFEIFEDRMEISRYTSEGITHLKNAGAKSEKTLNWPIYANVVESPQKLELNEVIISFDSSVEPKNGIMLDVSQNLNIGLDVKNCENFSVLWESSDGSIAEVIGNKTDSSKAVITGNKYGTVMITAKVYKMNVENAVAETCISVHVAPENAIKLSCGEHLRFYGLQESLQTDVETGKITEREYLILNRGQQGEAEAFFAQGDEYVSTKEVDVIYVPGVGNVVTPDVTKNVLWKFEETEGVLEAAEYRLQVSPKSPYRYEYYIAVTSGVDMGLGYPNITNMRTCSKDTSDGVALFMFDESDGSETKLTTTHHYKGHYKPNENGAFALVYDEENELFVLDNTSTKNDVYYYGRIDTVVSDILMWTDAQTGECTVGSSGDVQVGGTLYIMHEGEIEELPITLEMLSGYEKDISGKYNCTLEFNGEVIVEYYELNVSNSGIMRIIQMLKNLLGAFLN